SIIAHQRSTDQPSSRAPYYWETHTPKECRQIEAAALAWHDREMAAMRCRQKEERKARQAAARKSQQPAIYLTKSETIDLVRELVASELPELLRALGVTLHQEGQSDG